MKTQSAEGIFNLRALLRYGLGAAVLVGGSFWVYQHWTDILSSVTLHPWLLSLLVPLALVSVVLIGLTNELVAGALGASLPAKEWLALGFASTLANYVLPMRAGAALRAGYYKERCGLSLSRFASSMAVLYLLTALVYSSAGLAATAALGGWHSSSGRTMIVTTSIVIACALSLVAFLSTWGRRGLERSLLVRLEPLRRGLAQLSNDRNLLKRVSLVIAAGLALAVARIWICFQALGSEISGWQALLIGSMAGLSLFITITPAALGIREAIVALTSVAAGLEPEIGVAAAVIDRIAAVFAVLLSSPFALRILSRAKLPVDEAQSDPRS